MYTEDAGAMAKRIADKELTDRNWDQEEEGEEVTSYLPHVALRLQPLRMNSSLRNGLSPQAGTFSVATDDVMKNRAIKKAKRRNVAAEVKRMTSPSPPSSSSSASAS